MPYTLVTRQYQFLHSYQQVFDWSSQRGMFMSCHQPIPQKRTTGGSLQTMSKAQRVGRQYQVSTAQCKGAFLSDQLAWVHNLRANISITAVFTSQNTITILVPLSVTPSGATFFKLISQRITSKGYIDPRNQLLHHLRISEYTILYRYTTDELEKLRIHSWNKPLL